MILLLKIAGGLVAYLVVVTFIGHRLRALHLTPEEADALFSALEEEAAKEEQREKERADAASMELPLASTNPT
jgi:hypothetical protein